jgi:hypothetical protein
MHLIIHYCILNAMKQEQAKKFSRGTSPPSGRQKQNSNRQDPTHTETHHY